MALEGATGRSRLAGLLWPESKESTARNNLAQAARRLRTMAGQPVVVGTDFMELAPVGVDVTDLFVATHEGRLEDAAGLGGELLAGYDFDECSDFDLWLKGAREQVRRTWLRAANALVDDAEAAARWDEATAMAERVVLADPVSEAAHLRVARLCLAKGDGAAAMIAYERCRRTLARELAVKPSSAMLEVLRAIREGRAAAPRVKGQVALPASVLHPPWVGRHREWAWLEGLWAERRGAIVAGAPGVGKSRLIREHAGRHPTHVVIEGRPGDADVPYATLARGVRALLKAQPLDLPEWALCELGRVMPELVEEAEGLPSIRSKLRFLDAIAFAVRAAVDASVRTLVVDDLQWVDAASVEAIVWIAEACWTGDIDAFVVVAHREDELPPETAAKLERALSAGLASRLELGPMPADDALQLVRALDIEALTGKMAAIADASHGVPLFLLEIVRASLLAPSDEPTVSVPDRVKGLVRKRLERLGEEALRLARVAAVAGPDFDIELAAHVLDCGALDLAAPWSSLEAAHVLSGGALSHDVIGEVLREELPRAVREHVHTRVAGWLEKAQADPALIAHHYDAGGRPGQAAPYLLTAGHAARGLSRITEAQALFERAARAFEKAGHRSGACDALFQLVRGPVGGEAEALAVRLEALADGPRDRARARSFRAGAWVDGGRYDEAEKAAQEAEELARSCGDLMVLAKAMQVRLDAAIRSGRVGAAIDALLEAFSQTCDKLGDFEGRAAAALYWGEVEMLRDRPQASLPHLASALEHLERAGKLRYAKARILAARARAFVAMGESDAAESALAEAHEALATSTGAIGAEGQVRLAQAELALSRADAQGVLDALGDLPDGQGVPRDVRWARVLRGEAWVLLARFDDAHRELRPLAKDPLVDARLRARARVARAQATPTRRRQTSS